jgi:hypothetical protein
VIPIKHFAALIVCVAAAAAFVAATALPPELVGLMAKAQIREPISSWCRGDFQARIPNTFAVAAPLSSGGGRYLVLGLTETAIELASFSGAANLACYSLAEAKSLNESIVGSKTIHGGISPTLNTTVVCGFVDNTKAVCWQYSPAQSAFVKVGEWVT